MIEALLSSGFMSGMGQGLGGAMTPAPAGPALSTATQTAYGNGMDGSGWAVNFGGNQSAGGLGALGGSFMGLPIWALVLVGGVIAWRKLKK